MSAQKFGEGAPWVVKVENLFNPVSCRYFGIFLKGIEIARFRSYGVRVVESPTENGGKRT